MKSNQNKQKLQILGELTAVVAHELKNPLGTIRNSLFLMQNRLNEEYVIDEFIDDTISRVYRNIDRCNNIVNDLLDFTRQTQLLKRRVNIKQLLDQVIEDLILPPSIKINNNLAPSFHLYIDPDRIHRVFLNLLKNSIEAIMDSDVGKGAGYVTVSNEIVKDAYKITFYDNGPGIDPTTASKLFEPLVSTKSFGVGLGLSIVQDTMKNHNGFVAITGELDEFTQVDLHFLKNKSLN